MVPTSDDVTEHYDDLGPGWIRLTLFRKSGKNVGQRYYKYTAPDGKVFSSLKKAKEYSSKIADPYNDKKCDESDDCIDLFDTSSGDDESDDDVSVGKKGKASVKKVVNRQSIHDEEEEASDRDDDDDSVSSGDDDEDDRIVLETEANSGDESKSVGVDVKSPSFHYSPTSLYTEDLNRAIGLDGYGLGRNGFRSAPPPLYFPVKAVTKAIDDKSFKLFAANHELSAFTRNAVDDICFAIAEYIVFENNGAAGAIGGPVNERPFTTSDHVRTFLLLVLDNVETSGNVAGYCESSLALTREWLEETKGGNMGRSRSIQFYMTLT
jgi:hypothetical protein